MKTLLLILLLSAQAVSWAHDIPHEHPEPKPVLDLQEFEGKCRPLVVKAYRSWMQHNPQWREFFPAFMWQIALESSCRPEIVNSIDAAGLLQLLTTAASDCHRAGLRGSRREVVFNLECSAWLQKRTGRYFLSERSEDCRIVLVWVGHLTGHGYLGKSQKVARKDGALAVCWRDGIGAYLEHVIAKANADHAHDYAAWIARRSGIAVNEAIYR